MPNVNLGTLGQFVSPFGDKIDKIDNAKTKKGEQVGNGDGDLSVAEIQAAADTDGDGKVSEKEADKLVEDLRAAAKESPGDEVNPDAYDKIKQAAMGPVDADVSFYFSRARYASVFCTRF